MFRKRNEVALSLLLSLAFSAKASGQTPKTPDEGYKSSATLDANHSTSDFQPDANLSKKVWKRAKWAEFNHSMDGKTVIPTEKTRVAAVWTEKFVYFAFWCKYERLNIYEGEDPEKERWELWNKDVAEVFLNPQPERLWHYYEFEVAPNNQWVDLDITGQGIGTHDAKWNSGFEHATHLDSKNHIWTMEMRIPLSSMNVSAPKSGMEWRANFFRAAGLGGDEKRKFLAWSVIPEGTTFHAPNYFGILRLTK
jgi:hypothetical protein